MIALVLACLAGITWFIRTFVLPPTITIPSTDPSPTAALPPQTSPAFAKAPVALPEALSSRPR